MIFPLQCHMLLNENIDMMDALNSTLPQVIIYVALFFYLTKIY